jgi:hypothetical protein
MNPGSTVLVLRVGKAHKKTSRSIGGLTHSRSGLGNTSSSRAPKVSMVNVFFVNPANTGLTDREKYWGNI